MLKGSPSYLRPCFYFRPELMAPQRTTPQWHCTGASVRLRTTLVRSEGTVADELKMRWSAGGTRYWCTKHRAQTEHWLCTFQPVLCLTTSLSFFKDVISLSCRNVIVRCIISYAWSFPLTVLCEYIAALQLYSSSGLKFTNWALDPFRFVYLYLRVFFVFTSGQWKWCTL